MSKILVTSTLYFDQDSYTQASLKEMFSFKSYSNLQITSSFAC